MGAAAPEDVRFWAKVDKDGPVPAHCPELGPCWLWMAATNEQGYGIFRLSRSRRNIRAHRWAFEQENGPIPDGLEPDHLCRVHACIRPSHQEAVSHQENNRRGLPGRRSWRRERTHCRNGHRFTKATTRWAAKRGGGLERRCRVCDREACARYRESA